MTSWPSIVVVRRAVRAACRSGQQAYWVCPLIEESEVLQCQAAEKTAEFLATALPDVRIGLVHGRLQPAQKETLMAAFKAGDIDLLVGIAYTPERAKRFDYTSQTLINNWGVVYRNSAASVTSLADLQGTVELLREAGAID